MVNTPLWFEGSSSTRFSAAYTLNFLPEYRVGLSVIGVLFMTEILPVLHFELFHRDCCGLARLSVPWMQRGLGFVLKPSLVSYFICLNSIFHLLVSPRVTLCHFSPHRFVSVCIPEQQMQLQLLRTVVTPPLPPLCILGTLGTWAGDTSFVMVAFNHCPPRPPTLFGRTSTAWGFAYALLVFQYICCWPPSVDRSKHFEHHLTRTSSTDWER